jgi:cyclopropane fatty-acyl-phospholipid synthase-like methyltransferase
MEREMPGEDSEIDRDREAHRKFYDAGVSALISAAWGGNLHMGLFATPEEPLGDAQLRTKSYLAKAAGIRSGTSVIEAACGVGTTACYLASVHDASVHATNISEDQLRLAAVRTADAGLSAKITFAFADYHDLGGPDDHYDVWWCQEALLYATARDRVFREAARVVRPGGRIVFTDLTLSRGIPAEERLAFGTSIRAFHLWDINDYDTLFAQQGMRVLERQDWSSHVAPTFAAVARQLESVKAAFVSRIGEEPVRGTQERIKRQLDMAMSGHLGCCFYALAVA